MQKSLVSYLISAIIATGVCSQAVSFEGENTKNVATIAKQQNVGFKIIANNIKKSPSDTATYQAILLDNEMTVLLISDPKANKSLMSAILPVGAMEDPISQQGLAHYLEHMALMGSKKFPQTNGLTDFLSKNGGHRNASTSKSRTAYYLSVNNNAFDEAVARLADALSEPLLLEKNSKKEINAVNAEMVRGKSSEARLTFSVNLATSNPKHPMTKFSTGNNETLSDKPNSKLQDELQKFHKEYYSANLVKAVLYSDQSIEQLQKLAVKTLGLMKNKNVQKPTVNVPLYREQDKSVVISYKPINPIKVLNISFDFPNDEDKFKHKTYRYLSSVLGGNTDNTLSDYLVKEGLILGMSLDGNSNINRNTGVFNFNLVLTDKGLEQKDKIISMVFEYIDKVKKEGIQESYFNEMKDILNREFTHLKHKKTLSFIENISDKMLMYPLENVINSSFEITTMDKKAIKEKLEAMTLDNARILLVSENVKTDKKTPHLNAPYSIRKITNEEKSKWLDFKNNPKMQLPSLNPYVTTDFSLNKTENRKKPKQIVLNQGEKIYAMNSFYFLKEPKAVVNLEFELPFNLEINDKKIKESTALAMLFSMFGLDQSKITTQAIKAGISRDISYDDGLTITLSGYTQHFDRLLQDTLLQMKNFKPNEQWLEQARKQILDGIASLKKQNSLAQADYGFYFLTYYPFVNEEKSIKIVKEITLQDIEKAQETLFDKVVGVKAFSVGNLSDKQVKGLIASGEKYIKNSKTQLNDRNFIDFSNISQKVSYVQNVPNEDNAVVATYMVKGNNDLQNYALSSLLEDIISDWYFNDLRTDKQLGYVVSASSVKVGKTSGLSFSVQSPNTTPKDIMMHNERFFRETLDRLQTLSDQEFEKYREGLLKVMKRKPETLVAEFNRFSGDFYKNELNFDRREKTISKIEKLTKKQIIDFYKQAVIDQSGFVFISQALGTKSKPSDAFYADDVKIIKSIEQLQKSLPISHW